MHDLKLYGTNKDELESLVETVMDPNRRCENNVSVAEMC